jgi:H+-transporting ATPase
VPDTSLHPLRRALAQLWAPVPWMLEAAIVLEIVLGKYVEAAVIALLLVFNAALGFFQEGRAQATLAALKSRLALNASVLRGHVWATLPAVQLVPGDVVKLSLGAVVAADVRLTEGSVLLDQSMLTGESVPVEAGAGFETYAGALVRRGEAVAEVTATGERTKFGRTAELVRTAHVESSQQKAVLRVVRNLAMVNGVIIAILAGYAYLLKMPGSEIVPLVLTGILASIPVALPATFTLAAAVREQSGQEPDADYHGAGLAHGGVSGGRNEERQCLKRLAANCFAPSPWAPWRERCHWKRRSTSTPWPRPKAEWAARTSPRHSLKTNT